MKENLDSEKRSLIELAQFVLNRTTENVREELHNYLVEVSLYNLSKAASRDEIKAEIEKEFGFSEFPLPIIDFALDRLTDKLQSEGSPAKYKLSEQRQKEISNMFTNQKTLRNYVLAKIIAKIETDYGEISNPAKDEVSSCFFNFLANAFENLSQDIVQILTSAEEEIKNFSEIIGLEELLRKTFGKIENTALREGALNVVNEILGNPDDQVSRFLYALSQSHTLLKILNIDPQCQALEKSLILSNLAVYLDTNIVISLICEKAHPSFHESCEKLINFMRNLNIKVMITSRTVKEIELHLQSANFAYENMGPVSNERRRKLLKYMRDEIIREYWLSLDKNPGLKWKAFLGRLHNFSSIMSKKYSIEIDRNVYDEVISDTRFDEIAKLISESDPHKGQDLVEHDCFHIVLVDQLRKKIDDKVFPKRWFLTRDKSLDLVEKARRITEKKRPSSVYVDTWLQIISPLLSPKISTSQAVEVFANCFSSDILPSFPKINPVLLARLVGPCIDQTDLDFDEIKHIVGDTYLTEHFEQMGNEKTEIYLTSKLLTIREQKHKQELAKTEEKLKKEKEQVDKEKNNLIQEIDKLKKDLEVSKEETGIWKHTGRYLAGAIVFMVVWLCTFYLVFLPTTNDPYVSLLFSILIALIFGFLLGFKRYDWILEKFLEKI